MKQCIPSYYNTPIEYAVVAKLQNLLYIHIHHISDFPSQNSIVKKTIPNIYIPIYLHYTSVTLVQSIQKGAESKRTCYCKLYFFSQGEDVCTNP